MKKWKIPKSRFIQSIIPDYEQLWIGLGLIDRNLPRNIYKKWTDKQKFLAMEYAIAQHLKASDNIIYKLPKEPLWVKKLKESANERK